MEPELSYSATAEASDPLSRLAMQHDAKWGSSRYTPHYHQRFAPVRDQPVTILEIGIGGYDDPAAGGNSLRMWRDYFPAGTIIGLDIYDKSSLSGDRIVTVKGDQSDPVFLEELVALHGPFDIIIDDGSHVVSHVRQSFNSLFGHVKDGGWYVIEDLQTSYWEKFGGTSTQGTSPTTIDLLRKLIDHLHYEELDVIGYTPNDLDRSVVAVEVTRNIAFIRKGRNEAHTTRMGDHPHDKLFFTKPRRTAAPTLRQQVAAVLPPRLRRAIRALIR